MARTMTNIKFSQRDLLNTAIGFKKDAIPLDKKDIDEIFVKSQGRQFQMTPEKIAKVRQLMERNPEAGVSITIDKLTGQVLHIQRAS